jgi:hypothetical protein
MNIKRRNSQKSIKIINDYPYKLSKSLLKKKQSNQSLSSFSFKTYKPNQNNYINYTVLENKQKENYISKTSRESNDYIIKKKSKQFRLVNDYLMNIPKINYKGNSLKNFFNNKSYTERTYNSSYNKYQPHKNNNSFLQNKFNLLLKNDIKENKGKEATLESNKEDNSISSIAQFDKMNFKYKLNKNGNMPINKRIKMLKDFKYSINQMQKNSFNSFISYKSLFNYNDKQNSNNYPNFRNYKLKTIKPYNDISDRKPIIIKHFPKPKLGVPKFININKMNIF